MAQFSAPGGAGASSPHLKHSPTRAAGAGQLCPEWQIQEYRISRRQGDGEGARLDQPLLRRLRRADLQHHDRVDADLRGLEQGDCPYRRERAPVTKLLLNEMPDTMRRPSPRWTASVAAQRPRFHHHLLLSGLCKPCKHIAGVPCWPPAGHGPFPALRAAGSLPGPVAGRTGTLAPRQILASELTPRDVPLTGSPSFYTRPGLEPAPATSLKEFWTGARRLPTPEPSGRTVVPALQVKKQGDFPPFWPKDSSFIDVMEDLYERVRTKSPEMK